MKKYLLNTKPLSFLLAPTHFLRHASWRGTKPDILSEPGFVGFKDVLDVGTTLSPVRHGEERSHLRTVPVMDHYYFEHDFGI